MSQMGGPGYRPTPKSNVYTVMVAIAMVALVFGIVSVIMRSRELYPNFSPFDMKIEIREPGKLPKASVTETPATPSTATTPPGAATPGTPATPTGGAPATPPTPPATPAN